MKTLLAAITATTLALAPSPSPDGLNQSLDPRQPVASGRTVLQAGHVDLGPRYQDNRWTIQVHDGTAVPSVWRQPSEVVLRVRDAAIERVPDDPAYAFLEQTAGTPVYVVPQTQNQDVVWLGWNTQEPGVMASVTRGVTMHLLGVQGPGSVVTYLQSGNLGAPQVLWHSARPYPQPLWVETNTHTHANWIFSKPGVYLLAIEITADLVDGRQVSGRDMLRFAVGDSASADEAFTAAFAGRLPSTGATPPAAAAPARESAAGGPGVGTVALVAAAVLLVALLVWLSIRGARARRRAIDEPEARS
ncbi:choice-of-anchor M domain-containing protein [Dactylosporangium sp. NPDC005572]|uniref:choice-of-anchor M domain-containing protein n=1 Tax=Dactylosporangium sp. NPDC005572 TaxID=3156889 RepID=UPI0033B50CF6